MPHDDCQDVSMSEKKCADMAEKYGRCGIQEQAKMELRDMTPTTKQQLFVETEHLPHAYIAELQSFIHYLKFKQLRSEGISVQDQGRASEHDPILHAIGVINEAPFAETVDDVLYAI